MTLVLYAVATLGGISAVCAILLVLASKYMSVPVDEKFPAIRECLPGANCGACGYAGCDGYAGALASGEETRTNRCTAGGTAVAQAVAAVMGTEAEAVEAKAAFVGCGGTCDKTTKKADFQGAKTCASAKLLYGGDGACVYGCLGYGDCAAVCPEQAINVINGVARVNQARCTGCGMCTKACPNKIIRVLPVTAPVKVQCSSKDKGPAVRAKCSAGCLGCGMCMRKCPSGAIKIESNLAVIDYEKCTGCGTCKTVCPAKCIH